MADSVSLSEAIRTRRLADFIAQEEARGIGPAKRKVLDDAIRLAGAPKVTEQRSKGQTLRSRSAGGLTGK